MAVSNSKRAVRRIGIIEAITVLLIISAFAGVWHKYSQARSVMPLSKPDNIQMIFYCEEVPEVSASQITKGDLVKDSDKGVEFGHVVDIKVDKSVSYGASSKGEYVQSSKPGFASVYLTVSGKGLYSNGRLKTGVTFDNTDYWVGKFMSFRAGNSALYGSIYDIGKRE